MDNRLTPKWDTSIIRKRRKYKVIKTEDFERYQRIIAHYDEELTEARKCIDDINKFCDMFLASHLKHNKDLLNNIKEIIIEYYNSSSNYSDEDVKCLIEGQTIEAEDIQMNDDAKIVTIQSMEEYI